MMNEGEYNPAHSSIKWLYIADDYEHFFVIKVNRCD